MPKVITLPGDGIGPEVMAEVVKIIGWYGDKRDLKFDVSEDLVGGVEVELRRVAPRLPVGRAPHLGVVRTGDRDRRRLLVGAVTDLGLGHRRLGRDD